MVSPKTFDEGMTVLRETFDKKLSPVTVRAYMAVLRDYDDHTFKRAVSDALKTCVHFPRPVELRELCGGGKTEGFEAWQLVLQTIRIRGVTQSVDFTDKRTNAAVRSIGGWSNLCRGKADAIHFAERDFLQAFEHHTQQGHTDTAGRFLVGDYGGEPIRIGLPPGQKQIPSERALEALAREESKRVPCPEDLAKEIARMTGRIGAKD